MTSSRFACAAALTAAAIFSTAGCKPTTDSSNRPENARAFPSPDRPVSKLAGNSFSTEEARDNRNEAVKVMDMAGIKKGMTVADIGAGEGYYTVRLAERVGDKGRVLAQDIDGDALKKLGLRVERERLDNVSIKPGAVDDPRLPPSSFDRIFMVHMYHEISEPYAFLWHLRPALKAGGQVIVVDVDRPTTNHGIAPELLFCEFDAAGYKLIEFEEKPDIAGYFARFESYGKLPEPAAIENCSVKTL